jgi:hypothetical protein
MVFAPDANSGKLEPMSSEPIQSALARSEPAGCLNTQDVRQHEWVVSLQASSHFSPDNSKELLPRRTGTE